MIWRRRRCGRTRLGPRRRWWPAAAAAPDTDPSCWIGPARRPSHPPLPVLVTRTDTQTHNQAIVKTSQRSKTHQRRRLFRTRPAIHHRRCTTKKNTHASFIIVKAAIKDAQLGHRLLVTYFLFERKIEFDGTVDGTEPNKGPLGPFDPAISPTMSHVNEDRGRGGARGVARPGNETGERKACPAIRLWKIPAPANAMARHKRNR